MALCLLSGCYSHASDLVRQVGDQEVTVDMLTQLDRLVQLIESPIFTSLRMEVSTRPTSIDSKFYVYDTLRSCWTGTRS